MPEKPDVLRAEKAKAQRRVDYHFSPRSGEERWKRLLLHARSPEFIQAVKEHPLSDEKLRQHVDALHILSKAPTERKVESSQGHGKFYEIKKLPDGKLGCTCKDWRFRGTMNPGYECKHIKSGKAKMAAMNQRMHAFFDELSKIMSAKRKDREDNYDQRTGRPFSALLTQDNEPTDYRPYSPPPDEPDVIMRGYP